MRKFLPERMSIQMLQGGHTLVTCAKRDVMVIVCVIMRDQEEYVYQDTLELLEYGLVCYFRV